MVIIPDRHVVICHPIEDVKVVKAVSLMITIAEDRYKKGPGSTTAALFWYHDGKFLNLPYEPEKKAFYPPEEFTQMLNELADEGKNRCWTLLGTLMKLVLFEFRF